MLVGRITIEILRPVPLAPLAVATPRRPPGPQRRAGRGDARRGRRGRGASSRAPPRGACGSIRAVAVPDDEPPPPGPDAGREVPFFPTGQAVGYHTAMDYRFVSGGFVEPGPGARVAADAPAAGGGRAAVAARARARRGRLRQRRQRRARLPPLPVHQHRADGPPHARAGRRVGLPRRGHAARHARRRAGRGRAVRRAAAASAARPRRCSCGRADGSTERPAATGRLAADRSIFPVGGDPEAPGATPRHEHPALRAVYVRRQSPGRRARHGHSIRVCR